MCARENEFTSKRTAPGGQLGKALPENLLTVLETWHDLSVRSAHLLDIPYDGEFAYFALILH